MRLNRILSLAMLKMEKNFVAHNEKGYPRHPYSSYPLFSPDDMNLIAFVSREMGELTLETDELQEYLTKDQFYKVMLEVADVSNTLDYLFERLLENYHSLEEKTNG